MAVNSSIESKLDLMLKKLDHLEELFLIDDDIPEEDELEAIKEYLELKKSGKIEYIKLEAALDDL